MHIHGSQMNIGPINPFAAAAEKAIARQRAGTVRKKLAKSAREIENAASREEAFMVGRWMDSRFSQDRIQKT